LYRPAGLRQPVGDPSHLGGTLWHPSTTLESCTTPKRPASTAASGPAEARFTAEFAKTCIFAPKTNFANSALLLDSTNPHRLNITRCDSSFRGHAAWRRRICLIDGRRIWLIDAKDRRPRSPGRVRRWRPGHCRGDRLRQRRLRLSELVACCDASSAGAESA